MLKYVGFLSVCVLYLGCCVLCSAVPVLPYSALLCDAMWWRCIGDFWWFLLKTSTKQILISFFLFYSHLFLSLSLPTTDYNWLSRMSRISPLYYHYYHYIYINLKMRDIARCEHGGHHQRRQDNQALEHDDLGPGPLARAGKYWFKFWFRELLLYTGGVLFHVEWCIRHLCVFNHTQYYH